MLMRVFLQNRRWTEFEVQVLKQGCREFGIGSWSKILNKYRDKFNNRTQVDLKDKWRNIVRNVNDLEAQEIIKEDKLRKASEQARRLKREAPEETQHDPQEEGEKRQKE